MEILTLIMWYLDQKIFARINIPVIISDELINYKNLEQNLRMRIENGKI
jgi:hypothetical protein